jgi:hypothetical protein
LTAKKNRDAISHVRKKFLLHNTDRPNFFVLVCRSSRNEIHRQPVVENKRCSAVNVDSYFKIGMIPAHLPGVWYS